MAAPPSENGGFHFRFRISNPKPPKTLQRFSEDRISQAADERLPPPPPPSIRQLDPPQSGAIRLNCRFGEVRIGI
ncbi:hypothetical protein N7466_009660 [Penicillium verhagenii]|uniref:uncharacterized protein n=1 Tax=Penicillium verhagenii TaxID=1562060 RepID=UPI00254535A3|nr:uncharacterized protein N7466_009660 [Penicillium verhagenii]KAJ5921334.1 hypothetical protein N7466_009660 [Penicillium verhagenii]